MARNKKTLGWFQKKNLILKEKNVSFSSSLASIIIENRERFFIMQIKAKFLCSSLVIVDVWGMNFVSKPGEKKQKQQKKLLMQQH